MIADPCKAPLYPAVSGSAEVRRIRMTKNIHTVAARTSGYCVWFPSYHNQGDNAATHGANCFYFETATPDTAPLNTVAVPFGTAAATTAQCFPDAAYDLIQTNYVQDAVGLSACMKMMYLGQLSTCQGTIAALENVPLGALLTGGAGFPASITNLFNYATVRSRIPIEGVELKWSPYDSAYHYRTGGYNPGHDAADRCVTIGTAATAASTLTGGPSGEDIRGIGFVWNNLNAATTNDYLIDFTKIVQYRVEPITGIVESNSRPSQVTIEDEDTRPSKVVDAVTSTMGRAWNFVVNNHQDIGNVLSTVYSATARGGQLVPF